MTSSRVRRVPRRGLACAALAWIALTGCSGGDAPPSVLLVTLDTTRADHLGCYQPTRSLSPWIDRVAEQGFVFTRAYAQAAVTPVSLASIFTGLHPYSHGLRILHGKHENRLADSYLTLAEALRGGGYRTAAFVSAFPASERFGLAQGFEVFDARFLVESDDRIVSPTGLVETGENQRRADATSELAVRWLAGVEDRFFLWLHYFDPHDPLLLPPPEALGEVDGSRPLPDLMRDLYAREVAFMDRELGGVFEELEDLGLWDDLLVIVLADHGQGLGDHDWWTHGVLFEEQIRIPLIVKLPVRASLPTGRAATGRRIDAVVRALDVMPSILELTGIDAEELHLEGRSFVPLLEGEGVEPADGGPGRIAYADSLSMITYAPMRGLPADSKDDLHFAVTDGSWKYVHHLLRPQESELYDLVHDPRELENVLARYPQEARRLQADLMARPFLPRDPAEPEAMAPEDRERLEALGYIQ